jgi:hypothetical protein
MLPHENQNATVIVIEMGQGHVYVKIVEPRPEPQRTDLLLRRTIEAWFKSRPQLVIDRTESVAEAGEIVGFHVWYHAAENLAVQSRHADEPESMMIEVSQHVLRQLPKERVEAVVQEAMLARNENQAGQDSVVVVNARRIAVILDSLANRGAVIPIEALSDDLDDQGLLDWLESPQTRLYVIPVAGSWFARQAVRRSVIEPSFVTTNMVYDTGKQP